MHKNGLIVAGICEIISIIGFLYSINMFQYTRIYLWNSFAYDHILLNNMRIASIGFGIAVIVFLILIIYFYRKQ